MLTLRAPAKLNLDLRVGPPRPDGFHPLSSWFVTLSLADELTFQRHPAPGIHLTTSHDTLPTDDTNLVVRAARALLHSFPDHDPLRLVGIAIHLTKRIPLGAGLGGGSSDAATALTGVDKLLDLRLPPEHLAGLAASLGSDVAFFLNTPSALCTGRGEITDPLPRPAPRFALLILPPLHSSTPAIYKHFDTLPPTAPLPPRPLALEHYKQLAKLPAEGLLPHLANDLEAPALALHPQLADLKQTAETHLNRPVKMSGSGSTLFTLYDTKEQAQAAQSLLPANFPPTQIAGVSPVPPPHSTLLVG